jgi:hypothetical protein
MFFFEGEGTGGGGSSSAGATLMTEAGAGATTTTAAAPSWVKDDGTFESSWLEKLPEDVRTSPALKSMGSLSDLAKSYVATKSLVGTKLEMPGEGATPEAIANWRKVTGAPEKPEGYLGDAKTIRPDSIPEALWDATAEKGFLDVAHKHSLPPGAVKDILAYYGDHMGKALQASAATETATLEAEGTKLRTAWGKEYDGNLALASRVAQTVGLDPKTHPIFTSAEAVQAFAKMGKLLSEDRLVKGDAGGNLGASIQQRIAEITDIKSTAQLARDYRNENGPERQAAAQKQLHELMAAAKQN